MSSHEPQSAAYAETAVHRGGPKSYLPCCAGGDSHGGSQRRWTGGMHPMTLAWRYAQILCHALPLPYVKWLVLAHVLKIDQACVSWLRVKEQRYPSAKV